MPPEVSLLTLDTVPTQLQSMVDREALEIELHAHLAFTVMLELRVVAPVAIVLARRLGSGPYARFGRPLRRIAHDEIDHVQAARDLLREMDVECPRNVPALETALSDVARYGLPARSAPAMLLFLIAECVSSPHLGNVHLLSASTSVSDYLDGHAQDELRHGRVVRRLLQQMVADSKLRMLVVESDDAGEFMGALGTATRAYAAAFLTVLRLLQGGTPLAPPWPSVERYADHLAGGIRGLVTDNQALLVQYERGLASVG